MSRDQFGGTVLTPRQEPPGQTDAFGGLVLTPSDEAPYQPEVPQTVPGPSIPPDPSEPIGADAQPADLRGLYRQFLQGQSLGLSDEIGAGMAASAASVLDDAPFLETYTDMRDLIRIEDAMYRDRNPAKAVAGNVAGGLTTGLRMLMTGYGAAGGGVAGFGFSEADTTQDLVKDTAVGGALGFATGAAFASLGAAGRAIMNKMQARNLDLTDEAGQIRDEVIDLVAQEVASGNVSIDQAGQFADEMKGVLTPEQLQRVNLFAKRGVTPVRANITQSTDDFRNLQQAVKSSGDLAETVATQDDQLISATREGISQMGPSAQNLPETNANVYQVVDDVVGVYEDAVSVAYKAADEIASGEKVVRYQNLIGALKENIGGNEKTGGVVSAVRQKLKNDGVLTKGWKSDKLTDVPTAEGVRQHLNQMFDPQQPYGNTVIRNLKEALDKDVQAAVGDDVFSAARQANIRMKRLIERGARNKRDRTRGGFLEDVLSNKIPEEKIVPRLLTGRDDDMLKFKEFLVEESGEAGRAAWQDIKAQVLRDALERATSTQGKREGGQVVFNSRMFRNAFKNMRTNKKFDALFNSDEQALIDDIAEIGWLRIPQSNVQQGSGPSGFSIEAFQHDLIRRLDNPQGDGWKLLQWVFSRGKINEQANPLKETAEFVTRRQGRGTPPTQ